MSFTLAKSLRMSGFLVELCVLSFRMVAGIDNPLIYWTTYSEGLHSPPDSIQRATVSNGPAVETVLEGLRLDDGGMVIDNTRCWMYWHEAGYGIKQARLDGTNVHTFAKIEQFIGSDVWSRIQKAGDELYWWQGNDVKGDPTFWRKSLDGTSDIEVYVVRTPGEIAPIYHEKDFAVDASQGTARLYWVGYSVLAYETIVYTAEWGSTLVEVWGVLPVRPYLWALWDLEIDPLRRSLYFVLTWDDGSNRICRGDAHARNQSVPRLECFLTQDATTMTFDNQGIYFYEKRHRDESTDASQIVQTGFGGTEAWSMSLSSARTGWVSGLAIANQSVCSTDTHTNVWPVGIITMISILIFATVAIWRKRGCVRQGLVRADGLQEHISGAEASPGGLAGAHPEA